MDRRKGWNCKARLKRAKKRKKKVQWILGLTAWIESQGCFVYFFFFFLIQKNPNNGPATSKVCAANERSEGGPFFYTARRHGIHYSLLLTYYLLPVGWAVYICHIWYSVLRPKLAPFKTEFFFSFLFLSFFFYVV